MSMMTSEILKFVDSPKTKNLENQTFFLRIKNTIHEGVQYGKKYFSVSLKL